MKKVLTKAEWMERNGFGTDGLTWCVHGDDTFSIKNKLKELGFKFSPLLKWHSPVTIDVPKGYGFISFSFDEILEWNEELGNAFFFENAKEKIEKRFIEAEGPSLSEYVGEVGERLRNITAVYKSTRGFSGKFGWTNIHTFEVGNDALVWFTTVEIELEKGEAVDLTGTIVAHEEFRGVKTTKINRCIVKKVE